MRNQRFPPSDASEDPTPENVVPQPDSESLLRQIDAGLAMVEATLHELDEESAQYRHRLAQISGAAALFDGAGLVTEATAMHEGEETIAEALSENERRHTTMLDTARKLRAARDRLSPSGVNVVDETSEPVWPPASEDAWDLAGETTGQDMPDEELGGQRAMGPLAVAQLHAPPDDGSRSTVIPMPVITDSDRVAAFETQTAVAVADNRDTSRWPRKALVVVGSVFLLVLIASGALLALMQLGDQDDESPPSSRAFPATATDDEALTNVPTVASFATPPAAAGGVDPFPTGTELPAVAVSPTPPPTPTALPSTPTVSPLATLSVVPTGQSTAVALDTIVARVIDAESALQSGQIDASVEYTDGTRSSTRILFDFGAADGTAKVAISTTYQSGAQTRTTEQIMIGVQVWERIDGSVWQEVSNIEGVWGQVQVFLPRMANVPAAERESEQRPGELHWYDSGRNADITLQVDPASGEPEQMRQLSRDTGSELTITYTGWNTPTQIDPPVI